MNSIKASDKQITKGQVRSVIFPAKINNGTIGELVILIDMA